MQRFRQLQGLTVELAESLFETKFDLDGTLVGGFFIEKAMVVSH